ncbi:MAG: tetratricopeptide repeat protein [Planctomycetota bacterium]|jgi:tetratricopeptide (TPR) repeat protein
MEDESVEAFTRGIALCLKDGANSDEVRRHFQMLGRQMHWPGKDRKKFRERIAEMFAKVAKESSGNPKAVARLGSVMERGNRFKEALGLYMGAMRRPGGADRTVMVRAFSLAVRIRDMAAAEEIAGLVRKALPTDYAARLQLGDICMQIYGRFAGRDRAKVLATAEKLYTEAAGLSSSSSYKARAHYGAARAQYFAERFEQAAASYGRAAEAVLKAGRSGRKKWAEWEFERAALLVKLGRKQDATGALTRIVSEAPECSAKERARKELERLKGAAKK